MRPSVPILMYHQVTPQPVPAFRKYTVTTKAFATQMKWLALAGYVPITLDMLLAHRSSQGSLPSRPVVITFDDGFGDCVDHAVPVLQAEGFTATFYLVAGLMGQTSRWIRAEFGIELPIMDWAAARELEAAGFRCGAHSMSHPRLTTLSSSVCRDELLESREILEEHLGHEVTHLAYPFGSFDERVRAIAAEVGYRSACLTSVGLSPRNDDPLALHRVPIYGHDSLLDFVCRLHTGRTARELLRRAAQGALRRLRSR